MAHGVPGETDTVIVGNGPSALILSYILHGNIPFYDESSPHPDPILHEKLLRSKHDLLSFDIDTLVEHFSASRFSYSTQALPVNVLLDTLVRPLGETDDAQKKTCVKWQHDPARIVPHVVIGQTTSAGGQWEENPVHASGDIGTLSYAGMVSLPGYGFDEHYQRRNGRPMPVYLRPSRHAVADYFAAYPDQVGISASIHNGEKVAGVSRRSSGGFYIASHQLTCKNLVMASGIFDELIQPPPLLRPLVSLLDQQSSTCSDPLLVIGSGFSAADVIISAAPCQKVIHVYKWAPSTSPSPLRACHQQAYPEYAGVYRRMKLATISSSQSKDKRPKARHAHSDFDMSRDWEATYEGLPNTEIVDVQLSNDGPALVTFQRTSGSTFQRRVCGLAYVIGRRGSLDYLSPTLLREVIPADDPRQSGSIVSGQTLREKANDDFEVASRVFVIGSLTGDSLIRFAYGGCAFTAGQIMTSRTFSPSSTTVSASASASSSSLLSSQFLDPSKKISGPPRSPDPNGIKVSLKDARAGSRFQTPTSSPKIPAMNGLDGHEASPVSLDRRKE